MKISIFTTTTNPTHRGDPVTEALVNYTDFADEVVAVDGTWQNDNPNKKWMNECGYFINYDEPNEDWIEPDWSKFKRKLYEWPKEFKWSFIGKQFQRGYEACTGDWVLHMDLDFVFHEKDYERLRHTLSNFNNKPAIAFPKYQFFTPHKYGVKSLLVLAVNKAKYGDQIRFDGGGDLCQPTLNGEYLDPHKIKNSEVPIYNYDGILKTKAQIMEDKGRFARAWHSEFGNYNLGGPDDQSAYDAWWKMVTGRYKSHHIPMPPEGHPKVMQETIKNLRPDQFGHSMFGHA